MAQDNAVGGVEPSGNHYGQRQPPHERPSPSAARDGDGAPAPRGDAVELSEPRHAVFPLLRERVLAATRRLLRSARPLPAAVPAEVAQKAPAAAVAAIVQSQRRLIGECAAALRADQDAAFRSGRAEAEAILREVGRFDQGVELWLAAVDAAFAATLVRDADR